MYCKYLYTANHLQIGRNKITLRSLIRRICCNSTDNHFTYHNVLEKLARVNADTNGN